MESDSLIYPSILSLSLSFFLFLFLSLSFSLSFPHLIAVLASKLPVAVVYLHVRHERVFVGEGFVANLAAETFFDGMDGGYVASESL